MKFGAESVSQVPYGACVSRISAHVKITSASDTSVEGPAVSKYRASVSLDDRRRLISSSASVSTLKLVSDVAIYIGSIGNFFRPRVFWLNGENKD